MTAAALQFYAIGLIGYSVVRIASPTFYTIGQNRTPVVVSVITVLVNAALNIMLVRVLGFRGLALGTSIAALFNALTLLVILRRRLDGLNEAHLAGSLARITAASALMGVAAWAVDGALAGWLPGDALPLQIVRVALTIGAAVAVLASSAWLLRVREFNEGMTLLMRRIRRRP
jgi:putative peptidoglycan lipid II flippase